MEVTRESVLEWMKKEHHGRDWLAEQCGVGKGALSNWLRKRNPRKIPSKAVLIIGRLMEVDQAKARRASRVRQNLVLEFNQDDFSLICDAALLERKTPRAWAEDQLLKLASMDVEIVAKEIKPLMVVEDPMEYKTSEEDRPEGDPPS